MNYFPIFVRISQQNCLVVGGGDIALRKCILLLKAKANITCVALKHCDVLLSLAKENNIKLEKKAFLDSDINGQKLVISATNDAILNAHISHLARSVNIFVNVVDSPDLCSFVMPSIVDRSPVVIAVSSAGKAPVLARLLRAKIETMIPAAYGELAVLAGRFRNKVKAKFNSIQKRRIFWESLFSGVVAEQVFAGNIKQAEKIVNSRLADSKNDNSPTGEVYLVGGGPGDPDLLTFKALRLMQQADIILYDRLVSKAVMELVRRDAKIIYVGKERGSHSLVQGGINKLLVRLAKAGKRVCRLKGGDPFIFGRGGEEIEELAAHHIAFQVVPGITAASGCAAYSGIPLTHRDYSQSCRFVTGHLQNNTMDLPWHELVVEQQTIVFYMGLTGAEHISKQMIKHGMRADMPVALVEKGTLPEHKVHITTLAGLEYLTSDEDISAPTLIIVGEIVKLREKLNWYHQD